MCGVLDDKNEREDPRGSCRPMTLVRPALDERVRTIEEGTGKEIGGRMNTNASMYVRSYKAQQGKEWKNEGGTESGRNRQESSREEAELVRAYDEKRRPLPRKKGDGNGSTIT